MEFESIFPLNLGVAFDYKWIALSYGFNIPVDDKHTSFSGIRFSITQPKIWTKISWQAVNGFSNRTIENMRRMNADSLIGDSKRQYNPDYNFQSQSAYFNLLYAFNSSRYSHLASLWQINKQLKSAGSFALGVVGWYHYVAGDSVISPYSEKYLTDSIGNPANPAKDIKSSRVLSAGIQAGYAYTWILKRDFFIHLSTFPAMMLQWNDLTFTNDKVRNYMAVFGFLDETQFSAGYNGKRHFTGIRAQNIIAVSNLNAGGFEVNNNLQFSVFYGLRL